MASAFSDIRLAIMMMSSVRPMAKGRDFDELFTGALWQGTASVAIVEVKEGVAE